jgi:SAM-dependent methyltransferase
LGPSFIQSPLPAGAADYLRPDHPELLDLRARYALLPQFRHTQWAPEVLRHELELAYFRGDNAYNWQVRGGVSEMQYLLTAYYVREVDHLGLFNRLTEDDLFGAHTFDFNGRQRISRDLLDSILQINFMDRTMGLSRIPNARVLDIGAGYGRLAWRLVEGMPNVARVWSADAIADSTFLCAYYLRFRKAGEKAVVVPADRAELTLHNERIDIVTNIQSFTECTTQSIRWWLDLLPAASAPYLMIVPNTPDQLLSMEPDGTRHDFLPLIEKYGYRLIAKELAYADAPSIQKFGVYGGLKYWMFQRS